MANQSYFDEAIRDLAHQSIAHEEKEFDMALRVLKSSFSNSDDADWCTVAIACAIDDSCERTSNAG